MVLANETSDRWGRIVTENPLLQDVRVPSLILNQVLETRIPIVAGDALVDGRFGSSGTIQGSGICCLAAVPIMSGDDLRGILYLDSCSEVGVFDQDTLTTLVPLGRAIALALREMETRPTAGGRRAKEGGLVTAETTSSGLRIEPRMLTR